MTKQHANRKEEVRAACQQFHDEHPEIWDYFVRFAFEKIALGFTHYGPDEILARVRWETDLDVAHPSLKVNNNFRPFYSRRFATIYPEHADFFRFRRQFSEDRPAIGRPQPTLDELESN